MQGIAVFGGNPTYETWRCLVGAFAASRSEMGIGVVKTVESYIEQHHMIEQGDTIIAGVSGGADSVCLFLILLEYCKKKGAALIVVHINHGIRKEAAKDAAFVEELCRREGVKFYLCCEDISAYAKQLGIGTEEAGRLFRYESFEKIRAPFLEKGKIAVAHNRNDQAETTLFHLFRGSGITGLSGMMPVRDQIIRPLLCVERKDIEEYLTTKGIKWCIDSTNEENTYTRNKIRNVIFPYVEKEICGQPVRHVAAAAEELAKCRIFIEELTDEAEKKVLEKEDGKITISVPEFLNLNEIIQKQLLLRALSYLVPSRKDMGAIHVKEMMSLFKKHSGKQVHLPYGLCAQRDFDKMRIGIQEEKAIGQVKIPVTVPGQIEYGDITMQFSLIPVENCLQIPQKMYTKWFDYDKINNCLMIRSRQPGDYVTVTENGGHKTIKEYFIEEKISRAQRENKLLLADGSHILWVIGMRISQAYKVTDQTKTILQVTIKQTKEERG